MKRISKKSLDELASIMPVLSENEQFRFIGGGAGTETDPYSLSEYNTLLGNGTWTGGYVLSNCLTGSSSMSGNDSGSVEAVYIPADDGSGSYGDGSTSSGSESDSGNGDQDNTPAFNVADAIAYLNENANDSSTGYCARAVRKAIEAGGISTEGRPGAAAGYSTYLPNIGFIEIDVSMGYIPQAGDIAVMPVIEHHESGHIAMYNGNAWVSDFPQSDMYGGSAFRAAGEYKVFRHE